MGKALLYILCMLLLCSCNKDHKNTDIQSNSITIPQYQSLQNSRKTFQIEIPKDYSINTEASIAWALSYGSHIRHIFMLANTEAKADINIKSLDEYSEAIMPGLTWRNIEKVDSWTISNPKWFKVLDYRITWLFEKTKLVWYMRVIEGEKYYVQLSSWTTPSREAENKQELLNNLSSFDWVVQENQ